MCQADAGTLAAATISAVFHHASRARASQATSSQIGGNSVSQAMMLLTSHSQTCAVVTGTPAAAKSLAIERSEEHTSELQSLMRISYAVFCLKKKNKNTKHP